MIGAIKHFPGLGEANLDTHRELPRVRKSWAKLWAEDLAPYRMLKKVAPMVLIGHANYPAVTGERGPASLSRKWITEVLRGKIGYRGLVVSDDLEMGGVLAAGSIEQVAVGHVRAGGDLCLICHQEEFVVRAHEALIREIEKDPKFARRTAESARRVLAFKKTLAVSRRRNAAPSAKKIGKLSRGLWELGEQIRLSRLAG